MSTTTARTAPASDASTAWKETLAADEEARFAEYGRRFAELQQTRSARQGAGRALHRKQLLALRGRLEVLGGLPEFAAQGLFARPRSYEVQVRLSNGGMDAVSDRRPDIRGFAFAVKGVSGPGALGNGPTDTQCFALINSSKFAFPKSDEFVEFVLAAAQGQGALLRHLVRRYGLLGGPKVLVQLLKSIGRPFSGFPSETFHSAAPIACGPYAVRVRLVPEADAATSGDGGAPAPGPQMWREQMSAALQAGPLHYRLKLQPFVDERRTPIEDASVDWPTPYTAVARLTLPQQSAGIDAALQASAESGVFDPWVALAAHRPLGDVMRARKVVYFVSQQGRGATTGG